MPPSAPSGRSISLLGYFFGSPYHKCIAACQLKKWNSSHKNTYAKPTKQQDRNLQAQKTKNQRLPMWDFLLHALHLQRGWKRKHLKTGASDTDEGLMGSSIHAREEPIKMEEVLKSGRGLMSFQEVWTDPELIWICTNSCREWFSLLPGLGAVSRSYSHSNFDWNVFSFFSIFHLYSEP